jgi:hypothetical protein
MALIAHFKFDGNTIDTVGSYSSNTPTAITFNSTGKLDDSAIFNGSSSSLLLTSTINLAGNANWTVSVWIKTTSSARMSVLSNSSGGPVQNDVCIENGKITYYHYNATWLSKQGVISVNDGRWHNLIWVNFAGNRMNMYVDGILDASMVDSTQSTGPVNQIGKNWSTAYFNGEMDDFRIYNDSSLNKISSLSFTRGMLAHWPLSSNLNDYSGYSQSLVNTSGTSTLVTSGKIGGAYTKTSGYYNTGITKVPDEVSISMWFRHNGTVWDSECLFGTRVGDNGFMFYRNSGDTAGYYRIYFWYNTTSATVTGYNTWPGISGFAADTWYHITMVRNSNGNLKFYKDGILSYNGTAPANFSSWHNNDALLSIHAQGNGSGYTAGDLSFNDIRIYNYALSEFEVKEIAKAKILHYNFNDPFEEATINYISGPKDPDNGWGTRTHTTVATTIKDEFLSDTLLGYKMDSTTNASSWSGNAYSYTNIRAHTTVSGNKYTASAWCYVSPECNIDWARVSSEGTGSGGTNYDLTNKGTWQRLVNTFTANADGTSNSYLYFALNGNTTFATMTGHVIFAGPQFEEKDHVTPFVDGTRNIGINDISGYKNKGTLSAISYSPKWVEDSKLGKYGIYFNGTTPHIVTGISTFVGLTNCTLSFWRKNDVAITNWLPFVGQSGSQYIMATSSGTGGFYHADIGSSWEIFKDGVGQGVTVAATPFTDQNWHHYVIRGVNLSSWTQFRINGYTGVWDNEGYFDDIRIYANNLSDGDILSLYERRANIDNSGNVSVNRFVQKINNADPINQAIIDKTFSNGLSSYTQSNCQVTLTDDGYRIYRPANLIYPDAGTTMWGGFRATFPDSCLQPGHSYEIHFMMKGQTSNDPETYFAWEVGWSSMGIGLSQRSATKDKSYTNFQSSDEYKLVKISYTAAGGRYQYPTWSCIINSGSTTVSYNGKHASAPNIIAGDYLLDSIYFPKFTKVVSVTSNVSFVVDNAALSSATANLQSYRSYDSYRQFKFGFTYSSTGTLGTDLYIKDFKVIDLTDGRVYNNFNSKSEGIFIEMDEITGTQNIAASQEIRNDGVIFVNGELNEIY